MSRPSSRLDDILAREMREHAGSPIEPVGTEEVHAPSNLTLHHNSLVRRRLSLLQHSEEKEKGIANKDVRFRDLKQATDAFDEIVSSMHDTFHEIGTGAGNLKTQNEPKKTKSNSHMNNADLGLGGSPGIPSPQAIGGPGSGPSPLTSQPSQLGGLTIGGGLTRQQSLARMPSRGNLLDSSQVVLPPAGSAMLEAQQNQQQRRKITGIKGSLQERLQHYRENPELASEMINRVEQRLRAQKLKTIQKTKGRRNIVKDNKSRLGAFTPENAKKRLQRKAKEREQKVARMKEFKEATDELKLIEACQTAEVEYFPPHPKKTPVKATPEKHNRNIVKDNTYVPSPRSMQRYRLERLQERYHRQRDVYERLTAIDKGESRGGVASGGTGDPDNPFQIPGFSRARNSMGQPRRTLKPLPEERLNGKTKVKPSRAELFKRYTRLPPKASPKRAATRQEVRTDQTPIDLPRRAQSVEPTAVQDERETSPRSPAGNRTPERRELFFPGEVKQVQLADESPIPKQHQSSSSLTQQKSPFMSPAQRFNARHGAGGGGADRPISRSQSSAEFWDLQQPAERDLQPSALHTASSTKHIAWADGRTGSR